MNCPNCGNYMQEGTVFCTHCGMQVGVPAQYTAPIQVPVEYKPISAWGYVGYYMLYQIPIIGFIFMLINCFGSRTNVHLKNLSRCYLILYIVAVIICVVYVIAIMTGMLEYSGDGYSAYI